MATRVSLGAIIGIIVSLLGLNGNRTVHGVTLFPDLLTALMLLLLTCFAVWLRVRKEQAGSSAWQVARTISATAGLIFAAVMTGLGIVRFGGHGSLFSVELVIVIILMFLTAFVAALVCGIVASVLVKYMGRHSR